ncbi:MAG: site-specific DNA-methyltransferase [Lentisphaeria bacterium]|nr:site-specific DNA-methyltransferase [Lentisphaeria bacterium]
MKRTAQRHHESIDGYLPLWETEPKQEVSIRDSRIFTGDALSVLKQLPDKFVSCIVTSPPYWGLRDYHIASQIGLEPLLEDYIRAVVAVFREARRVLRDDGTFWLNIGDGYTSGNRKWRAPDKKNPARAMNVRPDTPDGLKPKDLLGIPWRLAFALQRDGWYLREDIIWNKPNAMPESVKDRPSKSHEYIFLLSKSENYFYDSESIKEDACNGKKRNKRSVWNVNIQGFNGAHFATFPIDLILPCIKAGSRENEYVLDPFFGAGTVGVACNILKRKYIGIELNPEYVAIAEERLSSLF